jgi:phosphopantothenoylcysteine decarboxylase/phosphopantothenate--cysteine ligase
VRLTAARSAREMRDAVAAACDGAVALIMAAAVADFEPRATEEHKIKKAGRDGLTIEMVPTPDILAEVRPAGDFVRVGFKAESQNVVENAQAMLERKGLDLVVANDVTDPESGFAVDTNRVTIIDAAGAAEELPLLSKDDVAWRVLDRVAALLPGKAG